MIIQEAIKSGKPFHRYANNDFPNWRPWLVIGTRSEFIEMEKKFPASLTAQDIMANDWEIKNEAP